MPRDIVCPHCNKKNRITAAIENYGSPLVHCNYCKKEFYDSNILEISLAGIKWTKLTRHNFAYLYLILAAIAIVIGLLISGEFMYYASIWYIDLFFIAGLGTLIYEEYEYAKDYDNRRKTYAKEYVNSLNRIQDIEYVKILARKKHVNAQKYYNNKLYNPSYQVSYNIKLAPFIKKINDLYVYQELPISSSISKPIKDEINSNFLSDNTVAELKRWKSLLDDGIISQEEFDQKKKEILKL